MFTGLIEEIGTVEAILPRGRIFDIKVRAKTILEDISIGDSISISGVCQTVTAFDSYTFTVQAVSETISRTTFVSMKKGDIVNLERALKLGDRLGGHIVQGHVDGTGRILSKQASGNNFDITITPDPGLSRYIVKKGSITIDGISLTVTHTRSGNFGVTIIPHTLGATTLEKIRIGDRVNLETDVLAKYIEKLIEPGDSLTTERLKSLGF